MRGRAARAGSGVRCPLDYAALLRHEAAAALPPGSALGVGGHAGLGRAGTVEVSATGTWHFPNEIFWQLLSLLQRTKVSLHFFILNMSQKS